jgi:putative transposase
MSFVRISIHAVWGTKNRVPVLLKNERKLLCDHIKQNAEIKRIFIDTIDGHLDHLHCLMNLNAALSLAKQMQLIKGESAHWLNEKNILKSHFEWADEYYAESISRKDLQNVRNYILRQESHHERLSFQEEYNNFLKNWGWRMKKPG